MSYAAYTVATFDYPKWLKITSGCIMPVTVVSAGEAGASVVRIQATTGSGEAIEVTGKSRPAAGEQITVWRTTGPDGGFIYEMLEDIPPMRK